METNLSSIIILLSYKKNYNFIVKKGPVYKGYKMWVTRALCDTANESEGH